MRYFLVNYEYSGGIGQLEITDEKFPNKLEIKKHLKECYNIEKAVFTFQELSEQDFKDFTAK